MHLSVAFMGGGGGVVGTPGYLHLQIPPTQGQ